MSVYSIRLIQLVIEINTHQDKNIKLQSYNERNKKKVKFKEIPNYLLKMLNKIFAIPTEIFIICKYVVKSNGKL